MADELKVVTKSAYPEDWKVASPPHQLYELRPKKSEEELSLLLLHCRYAQVSCKMSRTSAAEYPTGILRDACFAM
jgi:hypothetical protein